MTEPKLKAVIYSRVSTQDQSTDNQVPVLRDLAASRGFELVQVYRENESAWKAGHQRELSCLVANARQRKFDLVLVWSLDRLSREGSLAILELVHKLNIYGIRVISYQESWTEAPGEIGEILYALAGWVAKMESERRSERTKAGLQRALREGKKLGRPQGSKDKKKRKRSGYFQRWAG
ncbi:Serine recombinase PinR [subsurface metagenome]